MPLRAVAPPVTDSPISAATPHSVAPPTSDQMANLNRRVSQTGWKPLPSFSTNGAVYQSHNTPARDFSGRPVEAPSPPREAWGAAVATGAPNFNQPVGLPNGVSSSHFQERNHSLPVSSSTPNLLSTAPLYSQNRRPQVGRLDTIESISSSYGPGEPALRSHSTGQMAVPNAYHNLYPQSPHDFPHTASQTMHQTNGLAGGTNTLAGSNRLKYSRTRKGRKKKPAADHAGSQTLPPVPSAGKSDKGSKCVVM